MRVSGTETTEPKWKSNKELEPVFTELNTVNALMVTLDREGRIVAFNKACEQTTGYSFNEVRDRYLWELFLIPEEVEVFKAVCENLKTGSSPECQYKSYWVTKDGNRRQIVWSSTALVSNDGTVEYIISTGNDITQRKQTEVILRQQALTFQTIYDGIIVTDLDGRIIDWNPAAERMFGYSKPEVLGKTPGILHRPFEVATLTPKILSNIAKQGSWRGEIHFIRKDGSEGICETVVVLLQDEQDRTIATMGVNRDITERKRTEAALRSLYKISSARKLSFERRLQGLLALGCRRFGLDMGALGRVENALYEVIAAQVPPKSNFPLTKGNIWNLEQTYCRVTLGAKEPIAFEAAGTSRWCRFPAYSASRIEAYIGMPVIVDGNVYGTLSFFSLQARHHPFTVEEKELLKLMAQWLGAMLERQHSEEELRQSEARFRELAQREALLNQLSSQIRRSLDLNTILETAVHEIRNLLQIDRCFFLWYRPDDVPPCWEVIQEAKTEVLASLIGHRISITTFGPLTARAFAKEITRVDNARTLSNPLERRFFFSVGYTAMLALPIHTTSGEIGVVSCGHSSGSRPWRDSEVELLQAVADQLAIAIDQAQLLHHSRTATVKAQEQAAKLEKALDALQETQSQLVQSEKMSSLGQMVGGLAHEINNPINFIYGNLTYINQYTEELLNLIQLYQEYYPEPSAAIQAETEAIELDFIKEDLPKILSSMKIGADRISQIILSLRNFSRLDEADMKWVDIHEGLDNTLMILTHRLKAKELEVPDIQVTKDYGNLPTVQCYPGQLNQVFMNILNNAIEAIEDYNKNYSVEDIKNRPGRISICTEVLADRNQVIILISDNGCGMTPDVNRRIFDPFFTTKPVGQGTGLGMSISYKIVVEKHGGQLECISAPNLGAAFFIYIPIRQP